MLSHISLAGLKVSSDCRVIWNLKPRHHITLVDQAQSLYADEIPDGSGGDGWLQSLHVLVLDCTKSGGTALTKGEFAKIVKFIRRLKAAYAGLSVLLVDGGLNQKRVAMAFEAGVVDYYALPYDADLLVERIETLCARMAD